MFGKERLSNAARALGAGIIVGGFSAGFNPSVEFSANSHLPDNETHLILDTSPNLSTEDADDVVMTVFVSAYMLGMWAQVRKNLEIAKPNEKRFGWVGVAVQSLAATYAIARVWDADFGETQDDLDKAAISGFIVGYIGTKGALTMRGMSSGLPWTKAVGESSLAIEAAAGAYAIARVTDIIK